MNKFVKVLLRCICTPDFYGTNCETSFFSSDPCSNPSIPVLNDPSGNHAPSNNQSCSASGGCIDFSRTPTGWYRLRSPAGGSMTSTCPSSTTSCGSSYPYMLTNVVQEANANRRLYSARLSRVTGTAPNCYSTTETPYRVRILGCGSFNLYFLEPTMSTSHHYCIGDKQPCSSGLVSADGSGFEPCYNVSSCMPRLKSGSAPVPVLQQFRMALNSQTSYSLFNCSFGDAFETNFTQGLLYRVMYRLTFHNLTRVIIPNCKFDNLTVSPGSTTTVSCHHENILFPYSNIYGGTLECIVQSKCNSEAVDYVSQELVSAPHRFDFQYGLVDPDTKMPSSVLKPSSSIQLCIDIFKVPIQGIVEFRVTSRREGIIPADKMSIVLSTPPGNETVESRDPCSIKFFGLSPNYTKVCSTLQLMNEDEEGLIVHGLDGSQFAPVIEVNVSYRSEYQSGVFTSNEWVKIQSRQLTVDMSELYKDELKDYFHIYFDPYFKSVNSDTAYFSFNGNGDCRVMSLMRNTILPYEVQAKECGYISVVTEVAIRYEFYLIKIFSKKVGTTFVIDYTAKKLEPSMLPHQNFVPRGVSIEKTDIGVRIKLDLYGTIIYVWGFRTDQCTHTFIQSRKSMFENTCPYRWTRELNGFGALDVMIIPGFYDTHNRVDGLMYRPNLTAWKPSDIIQMGSARDMFSNNFVADRVYESVIKPSSELDFCSCYDSKSSKSYDMSKMCVIQKAESERSRKKRSISDPILSRPARSATIPAQNSSSTNVTAGMAAQECANYVQSVLANKAIIVSECSTAKGILGSVDFMTQFKEVCVQYATQLNTFSYTETLFNSFAGLCMTSLSLNVSTVINRPAVIQQMLEEACPNNCSSRGVCVSGACRCDSGFSGASCEKLSTSLNPPVSSSPAPENSLMLIGIWIGVSLLVLLILFAVIIILMITKTRMVRERNKNQNADQRDMARQANINGTIAQHSVSPYEVYNNAYRN